MTVRRVRRSSSSSVNVPDNKKSLSGFLNDGSSSKPKRVGSASVAGGGETRPSLTGFLKNGSSNSKLRGSSSVSGEKKNSLSGMLNGSRTKKKSGSSSVSGDRKASLSGFLNDGSKPKKSGSASVAGDQKSSLSGFLGSSTKPKNRGSSSVAGDQIAVSKEASLTGEIYVRADGKKVRRVKKSSVPDENVEIITRPDGTKVRRIRKTKPKQIPGSSIPTTPTTSTTDSSSGASSDPPKRKISKSLSGFFDDKSSGKKKGFSGSNSVAGEQYTENEIYIRADGKKVRRVRKTKPGEDSKSLAGFLDSNATTKPKLNGAATVTGDTRRNSEGSDKPEEEIYVRPDGKVRLFRFKF